MGPKYDYDYEWLWLWQESQDYDIDDYDNYDYDDYDQFCGAGPTLTRFRLPAPDNNIFVTQI